jgi:hypothetical protein
MMVRRLTLSALLLLLSACDRDAAPASPSAPAPVAAAPAGSGERVDLPIFGLPRLPATEVEFMSDALAHARIASSVRETVSRLLEADKRFAVTRFDGGTRLVSMDGSGRSIFVYRLPGEGETMLSYFASARPHEVGDGSAATPPAAASAPVRVRRGASAPGEPDSDGASSGKGGIKVGSDGLRFGRPDSVAAMQRLLERPAPVTKGGARRIVPNEPILDAAGRPTGYERTLYGRVVRSSPPPRVTPVRRNDTVSQY